MDKKFIDAEMLISELEAACMPIFEKGISGDWGDENSIADIINAQPAVDVQEVRHGKWIDTEPKYDYENHCAAHYQCSECGRRTGIKQTRTYKYCPRCGARMDGGE